MLVKDLNQKSKALVSRGGILRVIKNPFSKGNISTQMTGRLYKGQSQGILVLEISREKESRLV